MKQIPGFPDYYVTETGEVWSHKTKTPKKLKTFAQLPRGYLSCSLSKPGLVKKKMVHRLVAEAYLPNLHNLPYVCHKDDNRSNPHIDNLFWGTQTDNINDMIFKGRGNDLKGSKNNGAKLTESQVLEIRAAPELIDEFVIKFKCHRTTILNVIKRRSWTHI